MLNNDVFIPADVPEGMQKTFIHNYTAITQGKNRLFLFSCDHKIEHLNADVHGPNISSQTIHPEHFFRIASQGSIGAMATHLGLINRYAKQYPTIKYIVKLNATTHLVPSEQKDPFSPLLWTIDDVIAFKNNNPTLCIAGIGLTIYVGSEYESEMLKQAAQSIAQAHKHGLVAILWMYLRGKAILVESDVSISSGLSGIAVSLGADFAKIKIPPFKDKTIVDQTLILASATAGNTKVITAGGLSKSPKEYLTELYHLIHITGMCGTATGRNVFQKSLPEAIAFTKAISGIIYDNVDIDTAIGIFDKEKDKKSH